MLTLPRLLPPVSAAHPGSLRTTEQHDPPGEVTSPHSVPSVTVLKVLCLASRSLMAMLDGTGPSTNPRVHWSLLAAECLALGSAVPPLFNAAPVQCSPSRLIQPMLPQLLSEDPIGYSIKSLPVA